MTIYITSTMTSFITISTTTMTSFITISTITITSFITISTTTMTTRGGGAQRLVCGEYQFQCSSGECVAEYDTCNGIPQVES